MTDDATTLAAAKRYVVDGSSRRETKRAFDQLRAAEPTALRALVESLLTSTTPADLALAVRLAPSLAESEGLRLVLLGIEGQQDPSVLAAAAEALGELQGQEASEQLERLSANPDAEVRRAVAASLYGRRDSSALSALLGLVRDPSTDVSGWAAWALADNFDSSEDRDAELKRWLQYAGQDSQLAGQVRTALGSPAPPPVRPEGKRVPVPRERATRKRRAFTVLVVSANPVDTTQLALDEEVRGLTASIRATPARDSVELKTAWALRPYDLLVELNEHKPQVLHFSGHGMADGRLVFLDEARNPKPVDGEAIASTLATAGESIRVVVLNACFSAELAAKLTEHVDVAVGMDRPIGDKAAQVFAQAFYSALGYGTSVGGAFDQARAALMLEGFPEHAIARLASREALDPYELFLVDPAAVRRGEPGDDVETLRHVTANHLAHLARHALLPVGEGLEIQRTVAEVLRQRAEDGSLFVVGAPGSGKSGAIHRLARDLEIAGRDVVVIAADLLTATGRAGLREELGLNLDLVDVLAGWRGSESGFLIIDALDAARGREALTVLLEVIERVALKGGRWRVVASVRTFDLRHNPDLQAAIPGRQAASGAPDTDPEFSAIRHVAVGNLSDAELEPLAGSAPRLHRFLGTATPRLRDLLRVPFNLRLLSSLLERDDVDHERLHNLKTQLELLDLYWERRVLTPVLGRDSRELLAVDLCRSAVRTMRLQVPRDALRSVAAANAPHFEELLREGVLTETRGAGIRQDAVGFAHHVLFDYALHRLLLSGEPDDIARQLAESEELVLIARPSLVFTFVAAWDRDQTRDVFWNLVLRLASEDVPASARLVGPTVAAERLVAAADVEPLIVAIDHAHPEAPFALRHVVGAQTAAGLPTRPLASANLPIWQQLAVLLSSRVTEDTAYPLRILVWGLSSEIDRLGEEGIHALGVAARALLEWAWSRTPTPVPELQVALEGVSRSCQSDPAATDALLSLALEPERVPQSGYIELRPLTHEVSTLVRCVPDFVARLYETVFGRVEESEETTEFGSGQILRLTSTRRQDWGMLQYSLAQEYPAVVETDRSTAIRALAAACTQEAHNWSAQSQHRVVHFMTSFGEAAAIADGSEYWGSTGYHRDVAPMLDVFENTLADGASETIESILRILVDQTLPAAIWARVLRAAARSPANIAAVVSGVPASPEALMSSELREPICHLLQVGPFYWSAEWQAAIEDVVVALPDRYPEERREAAGLRRDGFLVCMPVHAMQRASARALRAEAESRTVDELPREHRGASRVGAFADDDDLRAQGIEPTAPATRDILQAIEPVSQFVGAHLNTPPSLEEARNAVTPITVLRELRREWQDETVEPLLDDAQAWLSEAAAALASQTPLPVGEESIQLARELGLEGVRGAIPRRDPDLEKFDDRSPGWGVPSGRIDAARALLLLSRDPRVAGLDLFPSIEALAGDEHPSVRWMVAHSLRFARQTEPARVWDLIWTFAEHEPSAQVLHALLDPLSAFLDERLDDVAMIVRRLYDREMAERRHESLIRALTSFMIQLWVWRGHSSGRVLIDEWIEDISTNASTAHPTFFDLRQAVTYGTDAEDDGAIRRRALTVWADLTRAASDAFHEAELGFRAGVEPSPEQRTQFNEVARLLDTSATEIYFGSGAYAEEKAQGEERLSAHVRRRFYREGSQLLDLLAPVGVPAVAHHLLQTLAAYVEFDPRGILLRVGEVLDAGRRWGYQLESLAEHEFVRLVETYLASHRDLLLGDRQSRQVLIKSLDSFVEAGWPSARRLLYGLDDMFR